MKEGGQSIKAAPSRGERSIPEVRLGLLKGGRIVAIGEEAAYLDVGRRGKRWRFSLRDLRSPPIVRTSWVTLDGPELLRTSPHATVIRDELRRRHPETWRRILDAVIGVIQENVEEWSATKGEEEARAVAQGTDSTPSSGEATDASEEAEKAELRRRAEEILKDPRLLYQINRDIGHTIMGEESTRILMWLLHLTSQVPGDYAFQTIVGESAVGKTTLVQRTLRYIPRKWWRKVGRISKTALEYLGDQSFQLLWIQEARGGEEASPSIRLSSADDGGLEVWVTERDAETGKFATTEIRLPGRSVITTTTRVAFNPQDATRTWLISSDASPEQTRRIIDYKLGQAAEPPELLKALGRAPEDLAPVVQEAVSMLDYEAPVVVAYADKLRELLSNQVVRARRDVDKMLGLIRILARVHQHQRPTVEVGGRRFIYATAADAFIAFELGEEPLEETLTGLEKRLMEVYKVVKKVGVATNRSVATALRKGTAYARRSLWVLVNMGYLDIDESEKTHVYTMRADMASNSVRSRLTLLRTSTLQEKVESAFSTITSQRLTDGAITCVIPISPETGYFSPITGEWRIWEAETHVPAPPQDVETLKRYRPRTAPEGRSLEEAINDFLDAEGGSTTILRLQAHLEEQGYGLEGLNDELARLQYRGKIVVTLNTISLGPEWRRPPSEEAPPVTDGAGGSPGAEEAGVEAGSEEDVGAVTGEPSPLEPYEAVMGIWTGLERDVEGASLLEGLAELLMRSGFPDPYGLVAEALPAEHLAMEGWRVELVGAELRPLGEEGKCAACSRPGQLYADHEGVWPVCLRCRLVVPATKSGLPWRFRVVTR